MSTNDLTVSAEIETLRSENAKLRRALAESPTYPSSLESISLREAIRTEMIILTLAEIERLRADNVIAHERADVASKSLDMLSAELDEAIHFGGYMVNSQLSAKLIEIMTLPDRWREAPSPCVACGMTLDAACECADSGVAFCARDLEDVLEVDP